MTPPRIIQFLALIAVMSATYPYIRQDRVVAGGFPVDARPQLALRVLRRLDLESGGPDHPLPLSRQYLHRHRRGNLRRRNHGPHRMASGMARRHQGTIESAQPRRRPERCWLRARWRSGRAARPPSATRAAASPPMPAPFSQDCQVGNDGDRRASRRCPTSRPRLQKRKQIKILAIGASPSAGRRRTARRLHRRDPANPAAGHQGSRRGDDQSRRVGRTCPRRPRRGSRTRSR